MTGRAGRVLAVAVAGLALTGLGVAPQLSARLSGEEIVLRVAPVDPIDPLRGAYVDLDYPDLPDAGGDRVFVTLEERGGFWVAAGHSTRRPDGGRYLACDGGSWRLRCGIESLFLPQDRAAEMETELARGALATVRVDRWGNAALVGVDG